MSAEAAILYLIEFLQQIGQLTPEQASVCRELLPTDEPIDKYHLRGIAWYLASALQPEEK